jgi:hypothetical protein
MTQPHRVLAAISLPLWPAIPSNQALAGPLVQPLCGRASTHPGLPDLHLGHRRGRREKGNAFKTVMDQRQKRRCSASHPHSCRDGVPPTAGTESCWGGRGERRGLPLMEAGADTAPPISVRRQASVGTKKEDEIKNPFWFSPFEATEAEDAEWDPDDDEDRRVK